MGWLNRIKMKQLRKKLEKFQQMREQSRAPKPEDEKQVILQLAACYLKAEQDSNVPFAYFLANESYRVAANQGDTQAQYLLGQRLMELGKFWQQLSQSVLAYGKHTEYANMIFNESFQYLHEAEANRHALAKRLLGLALIHGWGVAKDPEAGCKKVIDSIEVEGAWDRSTQILQSLGLNSPEFFNALMKAKAGPSSNP